MKAETNIDSVYLFAALYLGKGKGHEETNHS